MPSIDDTVELFSKPFFIESILFLDEIKNFFNLGCPVQQMIAFILHLKSWRHSTQTEQLLLLYKVNTVLIDVRIY